MRAVYSILILLYSGGIGLLSLFHSKAALWVNGRKQWRKKLRDWRSQHPGELIWVHCASLGEFEQGRPLIEAMRAQKPSVRILLTFFSPSGYEIRKHYAQVDGVFYLPADSPANARDFLKILEPKQVFFVKYEYWVNYFLEAEKWRIPVYMVSAILRPGQRFFGLFSAFWRPVLQSVDHFFVQDQQTADLLQQHGYSRYSLAGDTRFDRVISIAQSSAEIEGLSTFRGESRVLVAGSTWPADEKVLRAWYEQEKTPVKLILVPHEVDEAHLRQVEALFPEARRWSQVQKADLRAVQVIVVDSIGLLSRIYRYADLVWIGGGFGRGIHNTLEAAVWGVPVVFGPRYEKFTEARELIACGGGFAAADAADAVKFLSRLIENPVDGREAGDRAGAYVKSRGGATDLILKEIAGMDQAHRENL